MLNSSVRFRILISATQLSKDITVPLKNGVSFRICGFMNFL